MYWDTNGVDPVQDFAFIGCIDLFLVVVAPISYSYVLHAIFGGRKASLQSLITVKAGKLFPSFETPG